MAQRKNLYFVLLTYAGFFDMFQKLFEKNQTHREWRAKSNGSYFVKDSRAAERLMKSLACPVFLCANY